MREKEEVFFVSGSQHRVPGIETPVGLPFGDTSLPENLVPTCLLTVRVSLQTPLC